MKELAAARGVAGKVKIGVVTGDDLLPRLDELIARGHALANMDTGEPLATVRDRVLSANAYIGSTPIVEALAQRRTGRRHGPLHRHGADDGAAPLRVRLGA